MEEQWFDDLVSGRITEKEYKLKLSYKEWVVGARVRAIEDYDSAPVKGKTGMIKWVGDIEYDSLGVEFDERMGGHRLRKGKEYLAKEGHGWFIPLGCLELID